ncbi:MAG: hypothetical protein J6O40_04000 [Ruminococcus sp.]|nr:hypothetical protein [Ruminococcus sp.]
MNETNDLSVFNMDDLMAAIDNPTGKQTVINGFTEEQREKMKKPELTEAQANVRIALFLIFFLGGIIAAIVFSQTEPLLCFSSVGAIFLFIGLMAVFQNGIHRDTLSMLIFPTIGALMTFIPIIMLYHRTHPDSLDITRDNVIDLILLCMAFLGLLMLFIPIINHKAEMRGCSQTIMAKCIYLDIHFSSHHDARDRRINTYLYAPTWQYEIGDFLYVTREPIFTNHEVPSIGEMREIRYDPNDPSHIYRPVKRNIFIVMIIGAMFLTLGLLAFYFRVK